MITSTYRKIRRNIKEDGLIVSSSGYLVDAMLSKIEFTPSMKILEIGSGKGAFTREIVKRMAPSSTLDVCEIKVEYNPCIEQLIRESPDKQINLHNTCITSFLSDKREYDVIVSSLPLKSFQRMKDNKVFLQQVIDSLHRGLKEGGHYLQYQYFRSNQADIERTFGKTVDAVKFVPLNILPAFVYHMIK